MEMSKRERERERERERRGLDGKRDGVHLILPGTEIDKGGGGGEKVHCSNEEEEIGPKRNFMPLAQARLKAEERAPPSLFPVFSAYFTLFANCNFLRPGEEKKQRRENVQRSFCALFSQAESAPYSLLEAQCGVCQREEVEGSTYGPKQQTNGARNWVSPPSVERKESAADRARGRGGGPEQENGSAEGGGGEASGKGGNEMDPLTPPTEKMQSGVKG